MSFLIGRLTNFKPNKNIPVYNEEEVLETLDPTLSATFVTQKAGEESFVGGSVGRKKGRGRISKFRAAMKSKAKSAPKAAQARYQRADDVLANEEAEMEELDTMMDEAPSGAPSAAADLAFTSGLAQMRKSSKKLFAEEDDEEE